jgi:2'-5' RNA ligase
VLTETVAFGRVEVRHVSLMRSDLSPRGARYTELAAAPLARPAAG